MLNRKMTISNKLYNINRQISLHYIAMQKVPQQHEIREINRGLAECIKEIRQIEESITSYKEALRRKIKGIKQDEDFEHGIETAKFMFNTLFKKFENED